MSCMAWLAFKDFTSEWKVSICLFMGLTAVLSPLLVLFGVKFGIINTLSSRLIKNPSTCEIKLIGSGKFGQEWFEKMQNIQEVAFIIPKTRAIAATMRLISSKSADRNVPLTDLIPTGSGDPLLNGSPLRGVHEIVLSKNIADKLNVARGDEVIGIVHRVLENQRETTEVKLRVIDVLPIHTLDHDAALISLDLLMAVEDFRDGYAVPSLGSPGKPPPSGPRYFAGFRLFSRSIYGVATLRDLLGQQNLEVRTKANEIEMVISLERNLSIIFWIIAVIGVFGYFLSLGASILANVERKNKQLCIFRLLGFTTIDIAFFPIFQSFFIAISGSIVAMAIYAFVQNILNNIFASRLDSGEIICLLKPMHFIITFCMTIIFSILAAAVAGYKAARINPVNGFQDV